MSPRQPHSLLLLSEYTRHPVLSQALEAQAIGRAWRMGQTRAVVVKKLYVKGSVEERIMQVMRERSKAPQVGAAAAELAANAKGKKARGGGGGEEGSGLHACVRGESMALCPC